MLCFYPSSFSEVWSNHYLNFLLYIWASALNLLPLKSKFIEIEVELVPFRFRSGHSWAGYWVPSEGWLYPAYTINKVDTFGESQIACLASDSPPSLCRAFGWLRIDCRLSCLQGSGRKWPVYSPPLFTLGVLSLCRDLFGLINGKILRKCALWFTSSILAFQLLDSSG